MIKYFACGSNMFTARVQARVGSARPLGIGCLVGYRLCFNKLSLDGSTKCNIVPSEDVRDVVMGVVFELSNQERKCLSAIELGYTENVMPIAIAGKSVEAYAYVAKAKHCVEGRFPYAWYRDYVELGARHHGLPTDYIRNSIESVDSIADPDRERTAQHRYVLRDARRAGTYSRRESA